MTDSRVNVQEKKLTEKEKKFFNCLTKKFFSKLKKIKKIKKKQKKTKRKRENKKFN